MEYISTKHYCRLYDSMDRHEMGAKEKRFGKRYWNKVFRAKGKKMLRNGDDSFERATTMFM